MRFLRTSALALAVAAPLGLGLVPAHAGTNAVSVAGRGTINPGLPCPASGCAIALDFTALFAGQDASGTAACNFTGNDTFPGGATAVAGSGAGTITCSGTTVSASGSVTFSRTGAVVDVGGNVVVVTAAGTYDCVVDVTLAFAPTTPQPITEFAVTGGGTLGCTRR